MFRVPGKGKFTNRGQGTAKNGSRGPGGDEASRLPCAGEDDAC